MKQHKFELKQTEDGSLTIYNSEYNESMHSQSGAYEEAVLKHIKPSSILNIQKEKIHVLDIGFGMGYNILALLHNIKLSPGQKLIIISLENDQSYSDYLNSISFNDDRDTIYTALKQAFKNGEYHYNNIHILVHFADARKTISSLSEYRFDAVFQDPFSPAKNPELWSVEYFHKIKQLMTTDAILTTYSSASQVRMAMIEAGLYIGKGPSVGGKKEGTLASLKNIWPDYHKKTHQILLSEIKATPYHDKTLCDNKNNILQRRIDTMGQKRKHGEI